MKRYTFTVVPLDRNGVSRTLEMDGTETLDDLSSAILDAFGFDHCHLYMFSLTRKPYDDDGYYHPMAEKGAKADKIAIDSLELKSRRKILYLYDFGDEWMFHVTVKKVVEADAPSPIRVAESRGELEQYPIWGEEEGWEEDSWEEEDWEEDSWEEENWEEDDWEEEDLCVVFEEVSDRALDKILDRLPARYQNLWRLLVEGSLCAVGDEELMDLLALARAGLLTMEDMPGKLNLKVKKADREPSSYPWMRDLFQRCERETMLHNFISVYGVIEREELCRLCSEEGLYGAGPREAMEESLCAMENVGEIVSFEAEGAVFVTALSEECGREILEKRKAYPVKWYREWDDEELAALRSGDWREVFPVYGETFHYLFLDRGWNPDEVKLLLEASILRVGCGCTEREFLDWAAKVLENWGIRMKKNLEKQLKKLFRQLPTAVLKGHTWGEYEKEKVGDGRQMTLFDEELPF